VLDAMRTLTDLARECCRGQFGELCSNRWISEEEYLAIVSGKTAAPFVAAGVLGVMFGGGTEAQAAQIRIYASQMGIAFQIDDDLLDLIGEPGVRGKPVGNSLAQGRPMLPLIYLWRLGSDRVRKELCRLDEGGWQRDGLIAMLEQFGIIDRVRQVQQRHLDSAVQALKTFPSAAGIDALRELAARMSARALRDSHVTHKNTKAAGEMSAAE
jgi:geranylgeranyl pyrophosphate synthase